MSRFKKFVRLALPLALLVLVAACTDPVDVENRPDAFAFAAVSDADVSTEYTSNEVTLSGFTGELAANATDGTLVVNGADASGSTQVSSGDTIALRVTSSLAYGATVSATATVGPESASFSVTTADSPLPLAITAFGTDDELVPGTTITLAWENTGDYDGVSLVGATSGPVDSSGIDADNGIAQVVLPTGVPEETYTLVLTNSETAEEDDQSYLAEFELWVCEPDSSYNIAEYIPDENLLTAIRTALLAPTGGISCNNMRTLTALTWSYPDPVDAFSSLVGLQHANALRNLFIAENEVSDISPLAMIPGLEIIDLDRNRIQDLTPLTGLTTIVDIGLWDNGPVRDESSDGIVDITPLGTLVNLEVLYLSNNAVEDLAPLENLTNLRVLYALNNRITTIEALRNLSELATVRLGFQEIEPQFEFTDITPLANKPNLARLELQFIEGVNDASLAVLEPLTSLYMVDLRGDRQVTDLSPLVGSVLPANTLSDATHGVNAERDSEYGANGPFVFVCNNVNIDATSPGVADLQAGGVNVEYDGTTRCPAVDTEGLSMNQIMRLMLGDDIR